MKEHSRAGIRFLTYGVFAPYLNVTNVVTTRAGGRSAPPYAGLNLGFRSGDDPDAVLENRAIVAQVLGFEPELFTAAEQVHGSSVAVVRASDGGRGAVAAEDTLRGVDALVTNEPGVALTILVADCVAVSLYDTRGNAIAMVHAGWKGTLGRIVGKAVAAMIREYGTRPADIVAGLGPAVGPCHYPVGDDVAGAFRAEFGADAEGYFEPGPGGQVALDLWKANRAELVSAGVPPGKIECGRMCSACSPDLFYSYRRDGARTGRFAGIIELRYTGRRLY
ncbi:MAG: multicopper polyphenol oxidase [Candidatus Krumholzibacteriota bacterium]|nr:multicopper polyphenol oxidase [Candidatus Krumholzibacteriota bacterium]